MKGLFLQSLPLALSLLQPCLAKVVPFTITLTWQEHAADGTPRKQFLMNGQYPGPLLEVDEDDEVEFVLWNKTPNITTAHFHGIDQIGTPWSDGVPGLSQQPIKPDSWYLYKWRATPAGSYFYHSHDSAQTVDGFYGPIYIRPKKSQPRPWSEISRNRRDIELIENAECETRPIMYNTWTHATSEERREISRVTGLDTICSNSILVGGKGSSICLPQSVINASVSPALAPLLGGQPYTDLGCPPIPIAAGAFPFNVSGLPNNVFAGCIPSNGGKAEYIVNPRNKYARFDLIPVGQLRSIFSIDKHHFWVVAIDGRWVKPTKVNAVTGDSGQRFSIVVELDQTPGVYPIRVTGGDIALIAEGQAELVYSNARRNSRAKNSPWIALSGLPASKKTVVLNETLATPWPPIAVPKEVSSTHILKIDNAGKAWRWKLDNQSYTDGLHNERPLLFYPQDAKPNDGTTVFFENGTWADLIFVTVEPVGPNHPIHLHSTKSYILGAGNGQWNWTTVAEAEKFLPPGSINYRNPAVRDTYATLAATGQPTWLVIRRFISNPGAFLCHCHIEDHLVGGMAFAMLDGVKEFPKIPTEYRHGNGFPQCANL